jgi:hypothetical protein
MKGNVIGSTHWAEVEQIVESFNTEEMNQWREGVRKGVDNNDWEESISHRTYRPLSGALILLKHCTARLQSGMYPPTLTQLMYLTSRSRG